MQKIQFDYFTGMEAEQYSFYRVPKVLFTEPCFKTLSCEAKVLYGLMLDRMSLSIKNRWLDSEDRVYIIFTVEEIAELMNCGTQKAVKLVKELDSSNGIGLITPLVNELTIISGSGAASLYCKLLNEHHIVTKEIFNTKPSVLLKGIRNG